ncbi:hypothetical protein SDC9_205729 [bioreactor metagenome]|uniref:Uncharacterized protein n=1 Tax=bioreactor metagenome TaxID=1076179 RepID=A0A645J4H9_9ZZZZ
MPELLQEDLENMQIRAIVVDRQNAHLVECVAHFCWPVLTDGKPLFDNPIESSMTGGCRLGRHPTMSRVTPIKWRSLFAVAATCWHIFHFLQPVQYACRFRRCSRHP